MSGRIRAEEARAQAAAPPGALMGAAGEAIAQAVARRARAARPGAPIIALVGPGNNGGDALLAALLLRSRGFDARAWLLDPDGKAPADASAVRKRAESTTLPIDRELARAGDDAASRSQAAITDAIDQGAIFIDGLFGLGLKRPIAGLARVWVEALNRGAAPVLAVDLPSGIDADRGSVVGGQQGIAVRCAETVSFIADKPGLRTGDALDHVGAVTIASLGVTIDQADGEFFLGPTPEAHPPRRHVTAHKGHHGAIRIVGGASGMTGALWLAALAAQRAGAGKVSVAGLATDTAANGLYPEIMRTPVDAPAIGLDALVIGCGLGRSVAAQTALKTAIAAPCPLVLDADALNLLTGSRSAVAERAHPTLLTPHPLEAARLLGTSTEDVQRDRIDTALELARRFRAWVVLKGAGSVCAAPEGLWSIIGSGGPALATAGTGDVLAGMIGALLAQGLAPWNALRLGCWTHGAAGERWALRHSGAIGLSAAELPELIREILNEEARP